MTLISRGASVFIEKPIAAAAHYRGESRARRERGRARPISRDNRQALLIEPGRRLPRAGNDRCLARAFQSETMTPGRGGWGRGGGEPPRTSLLLRGAFVVLLRGRRQLSRADSAIGGDAGSRGTKSPLIVLQPYT